MSPKIQQSNHKSQTQKTLDKSLSLKFHKKNTFLQLIRRFSEQTLCMLYFFLRVSNQMMKPPKFIIEKIFLSIIRNIMIVNNDDQ